MLFSKTEYKEIFLPFKYEREEPKISELQGGKYSYKTIKVILKIKKGKLKDFKIDLGSLAEVCNNEKFKSLELIGWGLNDKSFEDSK